MSAEAGAVATHEDEGPEGLEGPAKWSGDQRKLAGKIAGAFVIGFFMAGVVGPIVLTVVIGLLQGYHRF